MKRSLTPAIQHIKKKQCIWCHNLSQHNYLISWSNSNNRRKEIKQLFIENITINLTIKIKIINRYRFKNFIEVGLTLSEMYRMYLTFCSDNSILQPVKKYTYKDIFNH